VYAADLYRATITGYDAGTHTVSLSLLDCPTAGMAGVACSEQCTAAELTVGKRCLVVIALDSQALVIATY